jgi:uncharacterized cupin superfamily protein
VVVIKRKISPSMVAPRRALSPRSRRCYRRAMQRINIAAPQFEYDPGDPAPYGAGMFRIGPLLGAEQLGATVYELAPGRAICPYHYETAEEEWLLVLAGTPTLRHPQGSERLAPWDVVCFPPRAEGAHKLSNDGEEPARVLMFSTVRLPAATFYPDSDKVGIWTEGDGGRLIVRRSSGVDYWDGETGAG